MKGIRLDRLGTREKIMLALAGLVVLALLADRLVVRSLVRAMAGMETETRTAAQELKYNREVLQRRSVVEADYARISPLLDVAASPSETSERMKDDLDALARRTGVDILSMKHRPPHPVGFCEEYAVEIGGFEASMENLLKFLYELTQSSGMMRVAQLRVVPDEGGLRKGSMLITKVTIPAVEAAAK